MDEQTGSEIQLHKPVLYRSSGNNLTVLGFIKIRGYRSFWERSLPKGYNAIRHCHSGTAQADVFDYRSTNTYLLYGVLVESTSRKREPIFWFPAKVIMDTC